MKKFLSFFIVFAFVLSLINHSQVSAHSHFTDLDKVPWAQEHIYYLSDLGIINGYGNGKFGPNDKITRAQAALMLVKALYPGEKASKDPGFKDLSKDNFYYNAIAVAADKGLITGYPDNTFRHAANITRAETAVLIDRAYNIARNGTATGLTDLDSVPWATESILDLSSANIITGYTDGTFKPKNNITRAEFSVVLSRTIRPSGKTIKIDELFQWRSAKGLTDAERLKAHNDTMTIYEDVYYVEQLNREFGKYIQGAFTWDYRNKNNRHNFLAFKRQSYWYDNTVLSTPDLYDKMHEKVKDNQLIITPSFNYSKQDIFIHPTRGGYVVSQVLSLKYTSANGSRIEGWEPNKWYSVRYEVEFNFPGGGQPNWPLWNYGDYGWIAAGLEYKIGDFQ
ncbi:S-layer homology domain-containing protein [Pseudalkalibacillus sp. SCS-8]|uniref:S-layer homology domain-containing protein n=1 Tax=Pseudalkalibacillus nanhaiensis TaxID=3115291 RepID=UPI0032DAB3D8